MLTPEQIKQINNNIKQRQQQVSTGQLSAQQDVKKSSSFMDKLRGVATDITRPMVELGVSGYNVIKQTGSLIDAIRSGKKTVQNQMVSRTVPGYGEVKPAYTGDETAGQTLKKQIGYGAEMASWLPFGRAVSGIAKAGLRGAVTQGLKTGLVEGATSGALMGGGRALQEDKKAGGVLSNTLASGLIGGVAGGTLGSLLPIAGKIFTPISVKTSVAMDDAINKGIKPYFSSTIKPEIRNQYINKAQQALRTINLLKPKFENAEGVLVKRNPQNRVELLEAIRQTKSSIFQTYDELAQSAGEMGVKFNAKPIIEKLQTITKDKSYAPQLRKYANDMIDEISELGGESPIVIQSRIKDLNESLAGYFAGRTDKAKARLDASIAAQLNDELDNIVTGVTGQQYGQYRDLYASLKTIEKDVARQVAVEARKNARGILDMTDVFTGGDLVSGILTGNPMSILRGAAGRGIKELYKELNNPNRYIKKVFDLLEKTKNQKLSSSNTGIMTRVVDNVKDSLAIKERPGFARIPQKFYPDDMAILEDFVDSTRLKNYMSVQTEIDARRIAESYGINPDVSNAQLANKLTKILDEYYAKNKKEIRVNGVSTPKTALGEVDDVLLKEARKYKSADEFIEAKFNKKPEYGMSHRPSWDGMPPAHNLLEGEALPRDVYTHPDYSISSGRIRRGDKAANESWTALQKIKGKPDAEINVYRAGQSDKLNIGDWVTFSKEYAKQSLEGDIEKVRAYKVRAKDIIFAGDDINEFGYYPKSKLTDIWNKANKKDIRIKKIK